MRGWIIAATLLLIMPIAAGEQVLINSDDWRDVYSGLQYAALEGFDANYFVDEQQAQRRLAALGPETQIILITGQNPVQTNTRALVENRGYEVIEEIRSRDPIETNHELIRRANNEHLILVDDAYGYEALSVANYANSINAGVAFADTGVQGLIDDENPTRLILYGNIASPILENIDTTSAEIINEQDRFENNFALLEQFTSEFDPQSILLTDGDFIEPQLVSSTTPVLFTGRQRVPQEVTDLLTQQRFRVGVMIGNSLAPNAQSIKDSTGMSVFIKFAQGRNQQQYELDLFSIPTPNPLLQINSAIYDPSQQVLLITFQNPGQVATYFSSSFQTPGGLVEDPQPVFLEQGSYKTVSYQMPNPGPQQEYSILYGAYPRTLELLIQGTLDIEELSIDDQSSIEFGPVNYDLGAQAFVVPITNTGGQRVYVLLEAIGVRTANGPLTAGSEVAIIEPGQAANIEIPIELTDSELARNRVVEVTAYFGAREESLIYTERRTLNYSIGSSTNLLPFGAIAVLVALVLILFVFYRRRNKKPPVQHSYNQHGYR